MRDGRMDRQTDGRTEWNQYTPQQLRCEGGIIIRDNQVNTMATDVLAPSITRGSATRIAAMEDKWVIFHEEGFQLPAPMSWEMIKNTNIF